MQSALSKDPGGLCCIFMDNLYTQPALFVINHELHDILASGTVQTNRIGLTGQEMILARMKHVEHGESLVLYDTVSRLLAIKWMKNKVVNCILTLEKTGPVPVQQRKGSVILDLNSEIALKRYQAGMGAVD